MTGSASPRTRTSLSRSAGVRAFSVSNSRVQPLSQSAKIVARPGLPVDLELAVAVSVRLLAVGRQEVGEPRAQVPGHVLHDDREAVRLGVERHVELVVCDLRERVFGELLQLPELQPDVVEVARQSAGIACSRLSLLIPTAAAAPRAPSAQSA